VYRRIVLSLAVALCAVAPACRSAPLQQKVCRGNERLVVRNNTGGPVDIYMVGAGASQMIGTVGVGRTDLPVPDRGPNVYFIGKRERGEGQWFSDKPGPLLSMQVAGT
jgi:hypothetical protein